MAFKSVGHNLLLLCRNVTRIPALYSRSGDGSAEHADAGPSQPLLAPTTDLETAPATGHWMFGFSHSKFAESANS